MHKGNHSTRRIWLWILLPLVLVTGCAVLTVDVDVYKGDLANQKDVQLKQLAAMTMAAKPVLEELRNELLHSAPDTNFLSRTFSFLDRRRLGSTPRYGRDVSGLLKNVDDVLSLYGDPHYRLGDVYVSLENASARFSANSSKSNLLDLHSKTVDFLQASSNIEATVRSDRALQANEHLQKVIELRDQMSNSISGRQVSTDQIPAAEAKKVVQLIGLKDRQADQGDTAMAEAWKVVQLLGLEGGRADKGIENIITDYLNYCMGLETNKLEDTNNIYVKRMWIAAVDFGEKVKFIADNETEEERTISAFRFVHRDIQTLQAIGNSILALADALNEHYHFGRPNVVANEEFSAFLQTSTNLSKMGGTNFVSVVADLNRTNFLEREGAIIDGLKNIQVVATLNGQTNIANRAKAAIDLLTAYRSDRAFILPTMAYLRSSYPATSLQKNDDGLWRNMLAREGLHALPWPLGDWFSNGTKTDREDAITQADIDKQFWQNINQIRVAGSGITSYVITKDDIGNWYVKSYFSDPTPIIEGAKSLALDSISPAALSPKQLGVLAQQAGGTNNPVVADATSIGKNTAKKTKRQKSPTTTNATATLEPDLLQTEFDILSSNYTTATLDDGTNILQTANLISNLSSQLGNVPPPSFTNTFTNLLVLLFTNTGVVSVSFTTNFSRVVTNNTPGQLTNYFVADLFSNSVINPGLSGVWTNEFSSKSNYSTASGVGTIIFTSSSTTNFPETPENVSLHSTNAFVSATNSAGKTPTIVSNVTAVPLTSFITNNVSVVSFSNSYVTFFTNSDVAPIVFTDIAASTNDIGSTNLAPATFYNTVTNTLTVVSIVTNIIQETITNSYAFYILYPTNGIYTNVFSWSVTNISSFAPPAGTNVVKANLTAAFNNTNGASTLPVTSVNLDFLRASYNQHVASALNNLASALTNSSLGDLSNSIPTIAVSEQKALQQWDQLINKTVLSGISNQNQIVLKYIAPQIRSLASERVENLKTYADGLKLLGQSQGQ